MRTKTFRIRRYLFAALVSFVVGIGEVFVRFGYTSKVLSITIDRPGRNSMAHQIAPSADFIWLFNFLTMLQQDDSAPHIIFGSTLLAPFAVSAFDVFALSRWNRRQGAA